MRVLNFRKTSRGRRRGRFAGGDSEGCNALGSKFFKGEGVTKSYDKAISFFQKALAIYPTYYIASHNLEVAQHERAAGH